MIFYNKTIILTIFFNKENLNDLKLMKEPFKFIFQSEKILRKFLKYNSNHWNFTQRQKELEIKEMKSFISTYLTFSIIILIN